MVVRLPLVVRGLRHAASINIQTGLETRSGYDRATVGLPFRGTPRPFKHGGLRPDFRSSGRKKIELVPSGIRSAPVHKAEWKLLPIDPADVALVYRRTHSMAPARGIASFECSICGETLENSNSAWVPSYRLIVGPVRLGSPN